MLWLIVLLIAIICLVWYSRQRTNKDLPPTLPHALPVLGHTYYVLSRRNDNGPAVNGEEYDFFASVSTRVEGKYAVYTYIYEMVKDVSMDSLKVGGVGKSSLGPWNGVIISDPDDALTVMNTCLQKDAFYDFWEMWLGSGIFTAKTDIWKAHKKMLLPAFSPRLFNEFVPIINKRSKELVETLASLEGKGEFDIFRHISVNVLQTFIETFMGLQEDDKQIINNYIDGLEDIGHLTIERFMNLFYHNDFLFQFSNVYKRMAKATKLVHAFADKIIAKKGTSCRINNGPEDIKGDNQTTKNKTFIEILHELEEKGLYTKKDFRMEVDSFIFGGHDTSATTMIYQLILIGSYQEVQDKMYAEIMSVIGNDDVTVQTASQLVYMEAVLKEVMRLYPIALVVLRHIDRKVELKNCTIPAGYRCVISIYGIHMHSVWGADAAQFRPERWLSPESLPANASAFAAFSVGHRACLGKMYAMLSMKTMLVHLLRRYRLIADHTKMKIVFEAVSKPKDGHLISLEPRNKTA